MDDQSRIPDTKIPDEDIREFQKLWKEEFKEGISEAYARQRAQEVLEFYLRLAERLPDEKTSKGLGFEPPRTQES